MAKISSWHFRHLLLVVWLKKACKRGRHGNPWNPLATPLQKLYKITPITNNLLPVYGPHSFSFTLQKETVR